MSENLHNYEISQADAQAFLDSLGSVIGPQPDGFYIAATQNDGDHKQLEADVWYASGTVAAGRLQVSDLLFNEYGTPQESVERFDVMCIEDKAGNTILDSINWTGPNISDLTLHTFDTQALERANNMISVMSESTDGLTIKRISEIEDLKALLDLE